MDPLAWLESLARRQGVDTSQLTTDADLDIAMPDANAVVDGPGYTPGYDVRPSADAPKTPTPIQAVPDQRPAAPPIPVPIPVPVQAAPAQFTPAQSAADAEAEMMNDPIKWLGVAGTASGRRCQSAYDQRRYDYCRAGRRCSGGWSPVIHPAMMCVRLL